VRVLDGLLTCGRGQRIGLFAGSGVGKSTLLGEIAKTARADMNVIALVGERGREVRPFLEDCLGETGRDRSVVVLATSEEPPLMRVRAVLTAVAIAASFRDQGHDVMFLLDSVTRMAMAQREIGLLRGEPPGTRGYTPSVFNLLASTLEKLGTSPSGSITGLITVLVDGDDMDEPVSDAVRGILDGHLILNRKLAARGHFPAVDVLRSVSRLFQEIADPSHREAARRVRECLATYEEMEDLIQIGAYKRGTTARIDRAIQLYPEILKFLKQASNAPSPWDQTRAELIRLGQAWGE
jgi:flagellum-specific ATP synthase